MRITKVMLEGIIGAALAAAVATIFAVEDALDFLARRI